MAHIRVLSWLLIGSLTHTAVTKAAAVTVCQPLDLAASSYIADHIMVILTGFAEQSKVRCIHVVFKAWSLPQGYLIPEDEFCVALASKVEALALILAVAALALMCVQCVTNCTLCDAV